MNQDEFAAKFANPAKGDVPELLKLFVESDGKSEFVWEVTKALLKSKSKKPVRFFIRILKKDKDPEKRLAAAYALGFLFDDRAIEPLLDILEDRRELPELRDEAADALGNLVEFRFLQNDRLFDTLCTTLRDQNAEVRFSAVVALGHLGDIHAVAALEELTGDTAVSKYGVVGEEAREAILHIRERYSMRKDI